MSSFWFGVKLTSAADSGKKYFCYDGPNKFLGLLTALILTMQASVGQCADRRKVIIDEDAMGPATTNQQAILMVLQASGVETLGITVVSGDGWRDEEVAHTLRMLEITHHEIIPVIPGAVFPLINTKEETARREKIYGRILYQGAWNYGKVHSPFEMPALVEGSPALKSSEEDAAHFLVRMVHQYPREVTILAAGPLTNIAMAIGIDPEFPDLVKELVFSGGRINPQAIPDEYGEGLSREFNFWFDPEAAHIVLRAHWHKVTGNPIDVTIKTSMDKSFISRLATLKSSAGTYIVTYAVESPMWDEFTFAAWIDPSLVTKKATYFIDAEIDHGASYGNTLVYYPGGNPGMGEPPVTMNLDLDKARFYNLFYNLVAK